MFYIKSLQKNSLLLYVFVLMSGLCQSQSFKVTLDAGHGDHDFGAVYNGHIEKNIALAIVLKVGKILESKPDVLVNYTRKTDVFIDLVERANIANRANATIFVSIHCNANKNTEAFGTETYVMGLNKIASNLEAAKKENSVITMEKDYKQKYEGFDPSSPESMIGMTILQEEYLENSISIASKVQNEFEKLGKKIRGGGVKQAPFMVLHKAYMPRVLIETGFISNPEEGNILDSEEGQNDIAHAIAKAILSYKTEFFGDGPIEVEPKPMPKNPITHPQTAPIVAPKKDTVAITTKKEMLFKIQLSASGKKIALKPNNFKGLKNVTSELSNKVYKYMYGSVTNYTEAQKLLNEAKSKGYASAFIIAFENGKKIPIQDALK